MAAVAMPRKSRKPKTSVNVVTTTADATAGSTPMRRRKRGTPAPTAPAITMFPEHGEPQHQTEAEVLLPQDGDDGHQDPQQDSVQEPEQGFPNQQPPRLYAHELAECDRANDEREGLRTADASLSRHNREEGREHHDPGQRGLEERNGRGGEEGGGEIHREPGQACADGGPQGPINGLPGDVRHPQHLARVVLDRRPEEGLGEDHANQLAVLDNWKLGDVVVTLQSSALLRRGRHRHGGDDGPGQGADRGLIPSEREVDHGDLAHELPGTLQHEDVGEAVPGLAHGPEPLARG